MKRDVIWLEKATAQLAAAYVPLWGSAEGRQITAAIALLEIRLEKAVESEGESRGGFTRVAFEPPVSLDFDIPESHHLVIVTAFRFRPPRRS